MHGMARSRSLVDHHGNSELLSEVILRSALLVTPLVLFLKRTQGGDNSNTLHSQCR
jgi:hypothetical protein